MTEVEVDVDVQMIPESEPKIENKASRRTQGICSSRSKRKFSLFHLSVIALLAFWGGVLFSHYVIITAKIRIPSHTSVVHKPLHLVGQIDDEPVTDASKVLITRLEKDDEEESAASKKLIFLYGDNIWTKYDQWKRYDWHNCPPKWSNCRITTNKNRLSEADAIVYNAAKMPSADHLASVKSDPSVKRVFLSGLTQTRTEFDPATFDNFFDLSITFKGDSDIRIPFWPNDGLLPAMYRPKKSNKVIDEEDMLDLEDEIKNYFQKFGKESFMAYTIKNCSKMHYPTLFVGKLREEGLINTFSLNKSKECLDRIKETVALPCNGFQSDDCVKHFEKFKFVIVPDEDLCTDYVTRDYWKAILAWQAVPLLYGASNYEKYLIPNSYIDTVGSEDYISPSFKKAHGPSQDPIKYYKQFHLWRHEDRIEEFYWQCELCRNLQSPKKNEKILMSQFWNAGKQCGTKLHVHELMRLQLVRTGVISG